VSNEENENNQLRRIWLALGQMCTLFRLQSGRAWLSRIGPKGVVHQGDGSVLILEARPITLGLGRSNGRAVKGPGDLTGWTSVQVTPEMVGCWVAVYTNIEAKAEEQSFRRPDQKHFISQVQEAGGIAGFAHTPEGALEIVSRYSPVRKSS